MISTNPHIKIFIAYAREDREFLDDLKKHLTPLCRSNKDLSIWDDGEIKSGTKWEDEIKTHLNEANIILLLVSANALASDYFYNKEMEDALKRHQKNEVSVIPIILSDCLWNETPLKNLQVLPTDGKPISKWHHKDEAYTEIVIEISRNIGIVEKGYLQEQEDFELIVSTGQDTVKMRQSNPLFKYFIVVALCAFLFAFLPIIYSFKDSVIEYIKNNTSKNVGKQKLTQQEYTNLMNLMLEASRLHEDDEYQQAITLYDKIIKNKLYAKYKEEANKGKERSLKEKEEKDDIEEEYMRLMEKAISCMNSDKHLEAEKIYQAALVLKEGGTEARMGLDICKKVRGENKKIIESISNNMVDIDGGTFEMGCIDNHRCHYDEKPIHKVAVDDFKISKYEVTQEQWEAVMGKKPDSLYFKCNKCPVERVSWYKIHNFIAKLNEMTDGKFRLPTEAEWEFAAIGGIEGKEYKYSGSNDIEDVAWYGDNSDGRTHMIGLKSPNELGLYDMTGNVFEWCSDWYGSDYYAHSPKNAPKGKKKGVLRVVRGGNWKIGDDLCRVVSRYKYPPNDINYGIGFRLAQTP